MKIHKVKIDNKDVFVSQRDNTFKVVKPWKNEDGTFNWFNFLTGGSWWNLIIVAFIVLVVLGTLYEYSTNIEFLQAELEFMKNMCLGQFTEAPMWNINIS